MDTNAGFFRAPWSRPNLPAAWNLVVRARKGSRSRVSVCTCLLQIYVSCFFFCFQANALEWLPRPRRASRPGWWQCSWSVSRPESWGLGCCARPAGQPPLQRQVQCRHRGLLPPGGWGRSRRTTPWSCSWDSRRDQLVDGGCVE